MITVIYLIIIAYFLIGGISFYFINRNKTATEARKNWRKFISYCVIIHVLFFSIVINTVAFRFLSLLIILTGLFELYNLFKNSGYSLRGFFVVSISVFFILSLGFFVFSGMSQGIILYSFLVLSIFDSFSQITGQLWGKKKILPQISPGKTLEGLLGGALVSVLSSLLFKDLTGMSSPETIQVAASIVLFAFTGDLSASYYKRKYKVKDFSNLIPGHGGVLDRFDSLIAVGAWIALVGSLINF